MTPPISSRLGPNTVSHLLVERCTVQLLFGRTESGSGYLNPKDRIDVVNSPCRIVDGPVTLITLGGAQTALSNAYGYFALTLSLGAIVVRDPGEASEKRYRVVGNARPSLQDVYSKVYLRRLNPGNV